MSNSTNSSNNVKRKTLVAVFTRHKWKLHMLGFGSICAIYNKDRHKVSFRRNGGETTIGFLSIDDIHWAITSADYFCENDKDYIANPYIGLSDEEILIKCDLENELHETLASRTYTSS